MPKLSPTYCNPFTVLRIKHEVAYCHMHTLIQCAHDTHELKLLEGCSVCLVSLKKRTRPSRKSHRWWNPSQQNRMTWSSTKSKRIHCRRARPKSRSNCCTTPREKPWRHYVNMSVAVTHTFIIQPLRVLWLLTSLVKRKNLSRPPLMGGEFSGYLASTWTHLSLLSKINMIHAHHSHEYLCLYHVLWMWIYQTSLMDFYLFPWYYIYREIMCYHSLRCFGIPRSVNPLWCKMHEWWGQD